MIATDVNSKGSSIFLLSLAETSFTGAGIVTRAVAYNWEEIPTPEVHVRTWLPLFSGRFLDGGRKG